MNKGLPAVERAVHAEEFEWMLALWTERVLLVGCPPQNTGHTASKKWISNIVNNPLLVKESLPDIKEVNLKTEKQEVALAVVRTAAAAIYRAKIL